MHASRVVRVRSWETGLQIRTDAVEQVVVTPSLPRANSARPRYSTAVRCVVARRAIERGERIAMIPPTHILTGQAGWSLLCRAGRGAQESLREVLRRISTAVAVERGADGAVAEDLFAARDALLLSLAVHALRHDVQCAAHPLRNWAAALPPRAPPLGVLLQRELREAVEAAATPLTRRVRAGNRVKEVLPDGSDTAAATSSVMLASMMENGLQSVVTPHVEVVPTSAMMASFYTGTPAPLTPRQAEEASTHRVQESTAMRRLLELDHHLRATVIRPLACYLATSSRGPLPLSLPTGDKPRQVLRSLDDDDDDALGSAAMGLRPDGDGDTAQLVEQLLWSHFQARSRAVNLYGGHYIKGATRPLGVVPVIIPFLDMFNHSALAPNVTYRTEEAMASGIGSGIVVTATRRIPAGDELTLHYGNYWQRSCLFGDAPVGALPPRAESPAAVASTYAEAKEQMRSIERLQRVDMVNDADDDLRDQLRAAQAVAAATPAPTALPAKKASRESRAARERHDDATWLWRFGFVRSVEEREAEAARLWNRTLAQRVARLTNLQRRGERGGFVISVPEGLRTLHEQRERLQRERYGGASVFPPQRV